MTYSHVLTNQGNQAEGGTCSAMSFSGDNSLAGDGWTSVVYYDANNNGELDPSDPVVESLAQITASGKYTDGTAAVAGTLPSGKGLRLFVKVFAPSSAAAGETDNRTLQAIVKNSTGAGACASPEPAAQSVVDTSNVMTAQIRLLKEQGLDAKCDGVVDLAFSATQIQVKPGECVIYRVQASNQGVDAVTNVIMNDSVPAFSTYVDIKDSSICTPVRPPRRPMAAPARSPATWVNSSLAPRPRCSSTSSWTTDRPFPFAWAQALASDRGGSRRSRLVIPKTLIRKD